MNNQEIKARVLRKVRNANSEVVQLQISGPNKMDLCMRARSVRCQTIQMRPADRQKRRLDRLNMTRTMGCFTMKTWSCVGLSSLTTGPSTMDNGQRTENEQGEGLRYGKMGQSTSVIGPMIWQTVGVD